MTTRNLLLPFILLPALFCVSCGSYEHKQGELQVPAVESAAQGTGPVTIDTGDPQQMGALATQFAQKRAIFIGEVHDQLEHHRNQLRVIQDLYQQYPDLAIGVEYLQQPFQPYLDDFIAGRIDEREMLRKTEYFKRWQVDFRVLQPIFEFARDKHIPIIALNVPDEIHNKVFRWGMKSLTDEERRQVPDNIEPASEHYRERLKAIFNSHPPKTDFDNFVEGVLLWDASMADTAARYLNGHPSSRMVVLAGMVHIMYGEGIPERLDRRLGGNPSIVTINGSDFGNYPGIADYQLATTGDVTLPKAGKLGVTITDGSGGVRVSEFAPGSAARENGIQIGDRIVALDGIHVKTIPELKSLMFDKSPGEKIQLSIERDRTADSGKELQFSVVLR